MDEMIRYIFRTLRNSETALQSVAKNLRKQGSFNRDDTPSNHSANRNSLYAPRAGIFAKRDQGAQKYGRRLTNLNDRLFNDFNP